MLAALKILDVKWANIQNTYLNKHMKEIVLLRSAKKFGVHKGGVVVFIIYLYGIKGDWNAWASALRQLMRDLWFTLCISNWDVWTRVAVDSSELEGTSDDELPAGESYYEYVLIHVDALMVAIPRTEHVMQVISMPYWLKKEKKRGLPYGPPNIHLGA